MAPELRKRAAVSETQKERRSTSKVVEEFTAKAKRRASNDACPISVKKPKTAKKTKTEVEPTASPPGAEKIKKPAKTCETEVAEAESVDAEEKLSSEEQGEDGMLLLADELDSGDEVAHGGSLFKKGQDVGKVPGISREVLEAAKPFTGERGVIYIGRIPHGFYEYEMRQYLSQFGPISRLRIARNKKTGASKHFAFVEFEDENTAEIVTKTMDNYLLFGHILKVKMVPKSQIHEDLFKGANRRFKKVPWNKVAGRKLAKPLTESAWESKIEKERANRAAKAARLQALGYEFDAPELRNVPTPQSNVKTIEATPSGNEDDDKADVAEAKMALEEVPEPEVKTIAEPKTRASKGKVSKPGKAEKAKA